MRFSEILSESEKQRLDPKCWKGYKKQGTKIKGGVRVNNCVPKESVEEDLGTMAGAAALGSAAAYGIGHLAGKMINKFDKKYDGVDRTTARKHKDSCACEKCRGSDNSDLKKGVAEGSNNVRYKAHPTKKTHVVVTQVPTGHKGIKVGDEIARSDIKGWKGFSAERKNKGVAESDYWDNEDPFGELSQDERDDLDPFGELEYPDDSDDEQGVAEGSENFTITHRTDRSFPGSTQVVVTNKNTGKQKVIAGDAKKIRQQLKHEFGIDYNFDQQGVAEGEGETTDVYRKVFKKNGKPVGEIGIDLDASPGLDGEWYVKHYASGTNYSGYTRQDAIDELKYMVSQGLDENYNAEYDDEAGMADNNLETLERAVQGIDDLIDAGDNLPEWCQEKIAIAKSMLVNVWDYMRSEEDRGAVAEDWQKANRKDKTSGMSKKAVAAYRREHPGSKLQTAVTTKPSKLKKGSKASKRRKSYCSRSKGQMDMHNIDCSKTPDKAICKSRRRWNCE